MDGCSTVKVGNMKHANAKKQRSTKNQTKKSEIESVADKKEAKICGASLPDGSSTTISKEKAPVDNEVKKNNSSIVHLWYVPHGFYEKEMKKFFSQFGNVKRLRLCRSRETGRSKGHAFIEFEHSSVAKIVCEAMNGYFLYESKLNCEIAPSQGAHKLLRRDYVKAPIWKRQEMFVEKYNKVPSIAESSVRAQKMRKKFQSTFSKLRSVGIEFDDSAFQEAFMVPSKENAIASSNSQRPFGSDDESKVTKDKRRSASLASNVSSKKPKLSEKEPKREVIFNKKVNIIDGQSRATDYVTFDKARRGKIQATPMPKKHQLHASSQRSNLTPSLGSSIDNGSWMRSPFKLLLKPACTPTPLGVHYSVEKSNIKKKLEQSLREKLVRSLK